MKRLCLLLLVGMVTRSTVAGADEVKLECIKASTDGQTLRRNEKLLDARQQLLVCSRSVCPDIVKTHCARWLAEVEESTPSLIVRARDAAGADLTDAKLTVDGASAPLDGKPLVLDPGTHDVVVEASSGSKKQAPVVLQPGDRSRELVVELQQPPPPAPKPAAPRPSETAPVSDRPGRSESLVGHESGSIPVGAWLLAGLGAAGLGAGGYFYYEANNQLSQLRQSCAPHCTYQQTVEGRNDFTVSQISFGAGEAVLGAAIVWGFIARGSGGESALGPQIFVRRVVGGPLTGVRLTF